MNRIYQSAPSVVWVRDADQTLLVDRETGAARTLRGAEAVVWGLVVMGHRYCRLVSMLGAILSLSEQEARSVLLEALTEWQEDGFLILSDGEDDG